MTTIAQLSQKMQSVLTRTARAVERRSGFVQRQGKLTGASWVQTLVLGWMARPQATLDQLTQMGQVVGVRISPQGLDQRFGPAGARLLQSVLTEAIQRLWAAERTSLAVLERFTQVILQDSTQIALPAELAEVWRGNGGKDSGAALKLQVQWDWRSGQLNQVELQDGRTHDQLTQAQVAQLPQGALGLADLGYFCLDRLAAIGQRGAFFLIRLKAGTLVFTPQGQPLKLLTWLRQQTAIRQELPVRVGDHQRLPARLIVERVPTRVAADRRRRLRRAAKERGQAVSAQRLALADWTLLITNTPPEWLSLAEVLVVAHCRWQIELLFKLWKSHAHLAQSRSAKPWRQLCEIYAKLVGLLLQHWLWLLGGWDQPDRSLFKAAQVTQQFAVSLACALSNRKQLQAVLLTIQRCLAAGCRTNKRQHHPATFQQLLDIAHA
jgi:hypothetical protein